MRLIAFVSLLFVAGCGHNYQRFVPVDRTTAVLDTKTGQLCNPMSRNPGEMPGVPLCYDLYKQ